MSNKDDDTTNKTETVPAGQAAGGRVMEHVVKAGKPLPTTKIFEPVSIGADAHGKAKAIALCDASTQGLAIKRVKPRAPSFSQEATQNSGPNNMASPKF